ncbi:MAG TPA: hypothetical protein VL172_17650 [Kofleriaceae bacterium]|nr:hypothetical protein [Kofleriaceae bacterium]
MRTTYLLGFLLVAACGGSESDRLGVGAECTSMDDCLQTDEIQMECLQQFAGGYCGLVDCTGDIDCPEDAACIAHDDGNNYCFRLCIDKPDCNANRTVDNESNCSSNVTFVDGADGRKACVPPSSGI